MKCKIATKSSAAGSPKSISSRIAGSPRMAAGSRRSARTMLVLPRPASRALACTCTIGSLSTYTIRDSGAISCATWWVFSAVGRTVPISRNGRIPAAPAGYCTARRRKARLARTADKTLDTRANRGDLLGGFPVGLVVPQATARKWSGSRVDHRHLQPAQACFHVGRRQVAGVGVEFVTQGPLHVVEAQVARVAGQVPLPAPGQDGTRQRGAHLARRRLLTLGRLRAAAHPPVVEVAADVDRLAAFLADPGLQFGALDRVVVRQLVGVEGGSRGPGHHLVEGGDGDVDHARDGGGQRAGHLGEASVEPVVRHDLDDRRVAG